jgi:cytochrome P450
VCDTADVERVFGYRACHAAPVKQRTAPGPRGVGATIRALRGLTSDPCPTLDDLVARHGPTFVVHGGPMTMAIVGDPSHLTQLLATSTDAFRWGHRFNVLGFIVGPGSMIVSDGDDHRRRRGATQPGFARRRLDSWIPLIVAETDRLIDETLLPARQPVDFYPHGRTLVRRIVVRVLFGDTLGARADELGAILEPAMSYGVQPALRQLPHPFPYTRRAAARNALREADSIIYEEIERRRRSPRAAEQPPDVLDTLIEAEGDTLSTGEIRDQTITLIAAGYDTTSSGLAWTVLSAAQAPAIWEQLRTEADRVLGGDLDAAAFRGLTYADAVVRESLRLHPPGVFSPRQAERDLQLGDLEIKKGTMIMWSPYVSGHLPEVWGDPLAFRPERFVEPTEEQQRAIDGAWLPYGKGPRACIGFQLAQMEMTLAIARLAQRVDVTLVKADTPRPVGMIVNRPEGGVVATITAREGIAGRLRLRA